jgi:hypothetical protein
VQLPDQPVAHRDRPLLAALPVDDQQRRLDLLHDGLARQRGHLHAPKAGVRAQDEPEPHVSRRVNKRSLESLERYRSWHPARHLGPHQPAAHDGVDELFSAGPEIERVDAADLDGGCRR